MKYHLHWLALRFVVACILYPWVYLGEKVQALLFWLSANILPNPRKVK